MAGRSRTCCVRGYCTGVPHNQRPRHIHSLRPISIPFTKCAEEPMGWTANLNLRIASLLFMYPCSDYAEPFSALIVALIPYHLHS